MAVLTPGSITAMNYLLGTLTRQGKDIQAILEKVIEQIPNDAHTNLLFGLALFEIRQYDCAEISFRRALQISPDWAECCFYLGNALRESGHLDDAESFFRRALEINPDFIEAYNNLGNLLRGNSKLDEAELCFRRVIQIKTDYAYAHHNLGNLLRDKKQTDAAIACFQKAIQCQPNFAEAYFNLANAFMDSGRHHEAIEAYQQTLVIKSDYAEAYNNFGTALSYIGKIREAVENFQRALSIVPNFQDAHLNLGIALRDLGRIEEAEASFRLALEIKPDFAIAHFNLGSLLRDNGQVSDAIDHLRHAVTIERDFCQAYNNLGNALSDDSQFFEASVNYHRALEINPNFAMAYGNLAKVHMILGNMQQADNFLSKAIELEPSNSWFFAALVTLVPYQATDSRFALLESVYAHRQSLPVDERIRLNFTVGKALEDIGDYDGSFQAYDEGNRLHYDHYSFQENEDVCFLNKTRSHFNTNWISEYSELLNVLPTEADDRVPIFIVGMPRSGSSLIEQMLASHPDIYGAGELSIMDDILKKNDYFFRNWNDMQEMKTAIRKSGEEYLARAWQQSSCVRFVTDKEPDNYRYLGLIHLMIPNAKIIHSVRDPMDTCFSCYSVPFANANYQYSFNLLTLGRRYLRYEQLMKHWYAILPQNCILDCHYETLVAEPEKELKRILDFLGLTFNPSCLNFYETKRVVNTASLVQVRQPLYLNSVGRWKKFKNHLSPLFDLLNSKDRLTNAEPIDLELNKF